MTLKLSRKTAAVLAGLVVTLPWCSQSFGDEPTTLLQTVHRHVTRTSTVPGNGDTNPYAIVVAPVSAGPIHQGDVLVDNFNNLANLQGMGTTIVDFNPTTKQTSVIAQLPHNLPECPGGVGLTTAMTMLKTGWIIVGSTPSNDGTTRTKGPGGLIVLDPNGHLITVWKGPNINGPWGNVAVIDNGSTATLFVSMAGFGVKGPDVIDPSTGLPKVAHEATVLRLDLSIPEGRPPEIKSQTVIAKGFGARADKDSFMIGPTGLTIAPDGTLYASDALGNQIVAIDHAATRNDSVGMGRVVTKGHLLRRPLALIMAGNGHLLTCNGTNGELVEIDPTTGKQLCAQWVDADQAQNPPGNGDLFGIAISPDGKGIYYVEDDMNTLVEAR
jgi:outer membrane protein assembly factor BamB